MLKTQMKLARLREEIARQQARQKAQRLVARKKRKAGQQRRRIAAKAKQRAIESRQSPAINLAENPFRNDPAEQKRAGRIRWRLDTPQGTEVRTLAAWCEYFRAQTGFTLTPLDLETLLRDESGHSLADVLESAGGVMDRAE